MPRVEFVFEGCCSPAELLKLSKRFLSSTGALPSTDLERYFKSYLHQTGHSQSFLVVHARKMSLTHPLVLHYSFIVPD